MIPDEPLQFQQDIDKCDHHVHFNQRADYCGESLL